MKKIVVLIILIALIISTAAGCIETPPPPDYVDPWYSSDFTKGETSDNDMFNDFIKCAFNTAELASITKITNNNKQLSLFLSFKVIINKTTLDATVKVNYNDSLKTCETGIEIFNGTAKIFALYIREFLNENKSELYFDFNNSKIKIISEELFISKGFPIKIDEKFNDYLIYVFNSLLKVKNIKYEYKNTSGKFTRHYNFEIDFGESLRKIYNAIKITDLNIGDFKMTFKEYLNLVYGAFGLTEQDIINNNITKNSVFFDFYTINGKEQNIGFGLIDKVKINVNIDESNKNNLFSGKKTDLQIELNSISIKSILINALPGKEVLDQFVLYSNEKFIFEGKLLYKEKVFDLTLDFVYDKALPINTNIDLKIKDKTDVIYHINYKNNLITIKYDGKTVSYNFNMEAFFLDFENKLDNFGIVEALNIIFAKMRINGKNVIMTVDKDFLAKVTPMIDGDIYYQNYSTDDVEAKYNELGLDLSKYFNEGFYISIDLDTAFLKTKE